MNDINPESLEAVLEKHFQSDMKKLKEKYAPFGHYVSPKYIEETYLQAAEKHRPEEDDKKPKIWSFTGLFIFKETDAALDEHVRNSILEECTPSHVEKLKEDFADIPEEEITQFYLDQISFSTRISLQEYTPDFLYKGVKERILHYKKNRAVVEDCQKKHLKKFKQKYAKHVSCQTIEKLYFGYAHDRENLTSLDYSPDMLYDNTKKVIKAEKQRLKDQRKNTN